jgi:hypothetical protein
MSAMHKFTFLSVNDILGINTIFNPIPESSFVMSIRAVRILSESADGFRLTLGSIPWHRVVWWVRAQWMGARSKWALVGDNAESVPAATDVS